ncbi:pilus assembly protein [Devosia sp. FKR38]|uniref:pilus assembly protein n=1 Tax=Devosia sp. FKR38 TaxID=2562312 RepID=UPI0010BF981D|nr:pilus assembly protein [Devosia sp. FKR38]
MLNLLHRFIGDRAGNFAILTAFLLPVVLAATGAAVDLGMALIASQQLSAAANGAVLAALSDVQVLSESGATVTQEQVNASAEGFFLANTSNLAFTTLDSVSPDAEIRQNQIEAAISFKATYRTTIMSLFGINTVPIANQAHATVTLRSYMNINILVDTSQSMGIGATDVDQRLVAQATGCAFACHIDQARGSSSYDDARAIGATMRIDVARSAVTAAVDAVANAEQFPGQVTMGLYRFSNDLTEILSPSDARARDLTQVKALAQSQINLDLLYGGTNIEQALHQIATKLPRNGTGNGPGDRIQYVIVVTDGVESGQAWTNARDWFLHPTAAPNTPSKAYAAHEVNYALNESACGSLTTNEIGTYFIYTEYLVPKYGKISSGDHKRFDFITKSLFPILQTRMSDCAGNAKNVLPARSPSEIEAAVVGIVRKLSSPLRLY